MSSNSRRSDEFAGTIGDRQTRGSENPSYALTPKVGGTAKALTEVQVQSVFDGRPIGAFDFVHSFVATNAGDPPTNPATSFDVPQGYTLILRRVEIEIFPPLSTTSATAGIDFNLLRDGNPILFNVLALRGNYEAYGWDTYHPFGYWQRCGLTWAITGVPDSGVSYAVNVRFLGNLVPTRGLPPLSESGSEPISVRIAPPKPTVAP
jgi:hypothetical protein